MAARLASPLFKVHPSVASALASSKPIVALESTIITHGLPYPANLQTAVAIEQAVRDQGAVPATTAFLDGIAHVGLDKPQLERLAEVGHKATKTSRRDVASVLAAGRGSVGATTVSGTMILAHMAGISIFGTGGIGGVHRGGENSLDISADLTELSRTPVAVFCSGAKSILDIPRTLEYLETMGVSTHTFDSSGQFPAFYSTRSGFQVPSVGSFRDAARLILSNSLFNMQSGMVFGVPVPPEFEQAGEKIQAMVEEAVRESHEKGIDKKGKLVTPWLLNRVSELTSGRSVASNKALVINNVSSAAKVAREFEDLKAIEVEKQKNKASTTHYGSGFEAISDRAEEKSGIPANELFFVGFTAVDITSRPSDKYEYPPRGATTWPGRNSLSLGGVARNMAESAHRMLGGYQVKLISPVGKDALGQIVRDGLESLGMQTGGLVASAGRTASVTLQLDGNGDLVTGVADINDGQLGPVDVRSLKERRAVVAFDGNINLSTIDALMSHTNGVTLFEPTSVARCVKIIDAKAAPDIITPNEAELVAMAGYAVDKGLGGSEESMALVRERAAELLSTPEVVLAATALVRLLGSVLLIKGGARGVLLARPRGDDGEVELQRYRANPVDQSVVQNTTGCGDTFAGAVAACAHVRLQQQAGGQPREWSENVWARIIDVAQRAAGLSLQSAEATSRELGSLSSDVKGLINCE